MGTSTLRCQVLGAIFLTLFVINILRLHFVTNVSLCKNEFFELSSSTWTSTSTSALSPASSHYFKYETLFPPDPAQILAN